jgi:hypothetical protein
MIFRAILAIAVLFFSVPAFAADPVPGSACGTGTLVTNSFQWAGGPENTGVLNGMFCNGSTWAGIINFQSTGKVAIGNTAPGALLDIGKATSTLGTMRLEGNTSGYVQLQPAAAAGSWTMTLPTSAGTNGYVLTTNGSGVTSWAASSGSTALSAITAATGANKINNVANAQEWDWNSLTTGNGLTLGSTSLTTGGILYISSKGTAAGTGQAGLWITLSGANAGSNKTTYGASISNTHSANGSTNVGLYATASGGATANYAGIFDQGYVGIGTTGPTFPLQIGSNTYSANARMAFGNGNGSQERIWSIGSIYGGATVTEPNYGFTIRDETSGTDHLVIDWNTGDVGIGTDTPVVDGTYQTLTLDGASGGEIFLNKAGTSYGSIWADNGVLGIGSMAGEPIDLLSYGGTVDTDGSIIVDQDALDIGTEGTTGFYHGLNFAGGGEAIGSNRNGSYPNEWGIDFYTDYTKKMSITHDGWVGIGTDAPDDNLSIVDSAGTGAEMDLDGFYVGRTDGNASYLWDVADEPMEFVTDNGNGYVTIDDNGSVNAGQYTAANGFIDTIYPSSDRHEFEYAGSGGGSWYTEDEPTTNALFGIATSGGAGVTVTPILGGSSAWNPSIDRISASGTDSLVESIYSGSGGYLGYWGGRNAFVWGEKAYDPSPSSNYFENFYPLMVLNGDGGLGVGTVNPVDNLSIEDPDGSGSGAEMEISGLYIGRWNGGEGYISDSAAGEPLSFYVNGNGSPSMQIDYHGQVGIGITPDDDLSIGDANGDGSAEIDMGSSLDLAVGTDSVGDDWLYDQGDAYLYLGTNGLNQLTIADNSNVGIDTTSPTALLNIYDPTGSDPGGTPAAPDAVLRLTRNGTIDYSYEEDADFRIAHGGPSVWGSRVDMYVNGASNTNGVPDQQVMSWDYNGNVGIDTTTPGATLDVSGSFALSYDISPSSLGSSQNNFNPTGLASAAVLRLTASTAINITGLAGGADGRIITIMNVSSGANTITLKNNSGSSSAGNKFCLTGDLAVAQNAVVLLMYDSTSTCWRYML